MMETSRARIYRFFKRNNLPSGMCLSKEYTLFVHLLLFNVCYGRYLILPYMDSVTLRSDCTYYAYVQSDLELQWKSYTLKSQCEPTVQNNGQFSSQIRKHGCAGWSGATLSAHGILPSMQRVNFFQQKKVIKKWPMHPALSQHKLILKLYRCCVVWCYPSEPLRCKGNRQGEDNETFSVV